VETLCTKTKLFEISFLYRVKKQSEEIYTIKLNHKGLLFFFGFYWFSLPMSECW